ncbi:ABC transporter substrate-binding protein [Allostreptomyces psammosilenae]|uniref:Sulfonate transport system substrate-binding protein n=1 Tax=Allostreptomyces psammosilenae TaxID=1892865 RepID=A0A852ZPD2_9ACTN|nr:ABC transporter substrate-binding protein [Allostreptomyces psammosilenae]NYI04243.1 sulfonate transport system substrate-binding protein [Allostreptomyces psammosilenae]
MSLRHLPTRSRRRPAARPDASPVRRPRGPLAALVLATVVTVALSGCSSTGRAEPPGGGLAADAALPTEVPPGTTLTIGDPVTQRALELSGLADDLPFEIEWANISGGPQTTEAFRAGALDVGSVADIPPIHATWTGLDVKVIAARFRQDPVNHPIYELGVAPGVDVTEIGDLAGKRIAYSPGQAQGALVLRVLQAAGLTRDDVELVELASTGDVYPTALASGQVDVAPLGGVNIKRYLANYGADGATTIRHGLRDDPSYLYVPTGVLRDPAKAAALREFVEVWAQAHAWAHDNRDAWIDGYYVEQEGLSREDGEYLADAAGVPDIPADWDEVIERQQQTIDLLAEATDQPRLEAAELFDRRFESVAADALGGAREGAAS